MLNTWVLERRADSLQPQTCGDLISWPYVNLDDSGSFDTTAALLLSCRATHDEMFEMFCSESGFSVHQGGSRGVDVLYGLRPNNIAALTTLVVTPNINRSTTPKLCHLPTYGYDACSRHLLGSVTPDETTPISLEIFQYLRTFIPAHALRHLRCLEAVFPPFMGSFLLESEPAYQDWLSVLDFVTDRLNCRQLILRVYLTAFTYGHKSYGAREPPIPTDRRANQIFESYRRVFFPLSVLQAHGLRHLFLDLASPFLYHAFEFKNKGWPGAGTRE